MSRQTLTLVPLAEAAKTFTPSARLKTLQARKAEIWQAFRAALTADGALSPYPGHAQTAIDTLFMEYQHAEHRVTSQLEAQIEHVCRRLEHTLANDAFTDRDARAAVVSTVKAHSARHADAFSDPHLYSTTERRLIDCYRQLSPDDRTVIRLLLRRFGIVGDVEDATADDAASESER